jgi:hypothetical protein
VGARNTRRRRGWGKRKKKKKRKECNLLREPVSLDMAERSCLVMRDIDLSAR